ncbi:hypothetical protein ON010_g16362 [Phytophthora cinnamomi]|nr:hypothetical protein ON010_g16362 [Phytophthora cinnamomi]
MPQFFLPLKKKPLADIVRVEFSDHGVDGASLRRVRQWPRLHGDDEAGRNREGLNASHRRRSRLAAVPDVVLGKENYGLPMKDQIHLLVERSHIESVRRNADIEITNTAQCGAVWSLSELQWTELPSPTELLAVFQRPIPFELSLVREIIEDKQSLMAGPKLPCPILETFGGEKLCPDVIFQCDDLVLLRGDEYDASMDIQEACTKMVDMMGYWNPTIHGDLPYILGYVTSGATLRIVSIDRILEVTTVLELDSIIEKKAEALKAFYNLTFVLSEMAKLHKVTDRVRLLPFKPEMDGSMLLLPMDVYTQCIIGRRDCEGEEDFARLASVFGSLQKLSNLGSANTHLETVRRLEVSSDQLVVQLSLLRFERIPVDADEIRQWVGYMLTALRHWHSCNYCHGDVCWENVVYVPVAQLATGFLPAWTSRAGRPRR